ncbi:hypothetical protein QQ045_000369 [Rhodiola kirilowii]
MTKRKRVDEGKEKRKHKKEDVSSKKMTDHEADFHIAGLSEISDARVVKKKQVEFLFTLGRLASKNLKLMEVNEKLTRVREEMGTGEAARAEEVILSNQVWELNNKIGEYIQELDAEHTFYAATNHDLTMIFLYLERREVKIASGLTKERITKLKEYASHRNINLID